MFDVRYRGHRAHRSLYHETAEGRPRQEVDRCEWVVLKILHIDSYERAWTGGRRLLFSCVSSYTTHTCIVLLQSRGSGARDALAACVQDVGRLGYDVDGAPGVHRLGRKIFVNKGATIDTHVVEIVAPLFALFVASLRKKSRGRVVVSWIVHSRGFVGDPLNGRRTPSVDLHSEEILVRRFDDFTRLFDRGAMRFVEAVTIEGVVLKRDFGWQGGRRYGRRR